MTTIGRNAFSGCNSLNELTLPFVGTTPTQGILKDLFSYTIPSSLKKVTITKPCNINANAFSGCSSLMEINLPNDITSIGNSAFSDCSSLWELNLPNSVISIGDYAFSGCSNLFSITIPPSVTSFGYSVFLGVTDLPK